MCYLSKIYDINRISLPAVMNMMPIILWRHANLKWPQTFENWYCREYNSRHIWTKPMHAYMPLYHHFLMYLPWCSCSSFVNIMAPENTQVGRCIYASIMNWVFVDLGNALWPIWCHVITRNNAIVNAMRPWQNGCHLSDYITIIWKNVNFD